MQREESAFEKAELKGIVTGGGIDAAYTASKYADVMQKAYDLGKSCKRHSAAIGQSLDFRTFLTENNVEKRRI